MQPYLFPYIGYYQLINTVDYFVIYDDVNYIKQGWINRNRIILNDASFTFNINLKGASSFKKINEIDIGSTNNVIETIEQAYRKAPFFTEVFPVLKYIILCQEVNLAKFLINSINIIVDYLSINTIILISSELEKDTMLKGENKIIDICKKLKATNYVNAIGGQELYSKNKFAENDLSLNFIKSKSIVYSQFQNQFIPWLSIIDVMMFNSPEVIRNMLNQYELI